MTKDEAQRRNWTFYEFVKTDGGRSYTLEEGDPTMIIDWQHHFSPKEIYDKRGGKEGQAVMKNGKVGLHLVEESYRLDKQLEWMDAAGVDMAVLSTTLDSVSDCRIADDAYSRIMKDHPRRFLCLAPCIPTRGEEALHELDRAIHTLGLKGVVISPQNDGHPLDSRRLWPFYELVSRWQVPIFIHITNIPVGYEALDADYNLNVTFTREIDIAANTVRLILGGVLTAFPNLTFVISHMGGGIASIMDRIEAYIDFYGERFWTESGGLPPFDKPYEQNFRKYFNTLFFDMAGSETRMNAVHSALTVIQPQRLLFATDYPYNLDHDPGMIRGFIQRVRDLNLPSGTIEGILGLTAARLLGISSYSQESRTIRV